MNGTQQIRHLNVAFENAISEYLYAYAQEHKEWMPNLVKPNKNTIDCVNYIMQQAEKARDGQLAILADQVVYDLAVKYYEDDSIVVKAEETPKASVQAPKTAKKTTKKTEDKSQTTFNLDEDEDEDDEEENEDQTPTEDKVIEMSVSIPSKEEKADAEGKAVAMLPDSEIKETDEDDFGDDL